MRLSSPIINPELPRPHFWDFRSHPTIRETQELSRAEEQLQGVRAGILGFSSSVFALHIHPQRGKMPAGTGCISLLCEINAPVVLSPKHLSTSQICHFPHSATLNGYYGLCMSSTNNRPPLHRGLESMEQGIAPSFISFPDHPKAPPSAFPSFAQDQTSSCKSTNASVSFCCFL